jgi:hypothetical protein
MRKRLAILIILALVIFAGCAAPAGASDSPIDPPAPPENGAQVPTILETLALLTQGAGVGLVLAFLAEKWPWFQRLPSDQKGWWIFGLSVGLPFLAQLLLTIVPLDVWAAIEPFWNAVATGFVGWAGSQAVYLGIVKPAQARATEAAYPERLQ